MAKVLQQTPWQCAMTCPSLPLNGLSMSGVSCWQVALRSQPQDAHQLNLSINARLAAMTREDSIRAQHTYAQQQHTTHQLECLLKEHRHQLAGLPASDALSPGTLQRRSWRNNSVSGQVQTLLL